VGLFGDANRRLNKHMEDRNARLDYLKSCSTHEYLEYRLSEAMNVWRDSYRLLRSGKHA
jgi:hypothetical protein